MSVFEANDSISSLFGWKSESIIKQTKIENQFDIKNGDYILRHAKKLYCLSLLGCKCNCGNDDPLVLDFHHIDPRDKVETISNIIRGNVPDCTRRALELEVKKCKILCRNCHLEFHCDDNSIGKIEILRAMGCIDFCQDCGYNPGNKISSLQFHHLDPRTKNFAISECYSQGKDPKFSKSMEEILLEVKKCKVLCANCHTIAHSSIGRYIKLKRFFIPKMKEWISKDREQNKNNRFKNKANKRYERKHKSSEKHNPFGKIDNSSIQDKIQKNIEEFMI